MTDEKAAVVELQKFEKRYGAIHAVKPLDLSIRRGETFAFLGPNGSGKSTIIRAIAGLHFPTSGKVLIDREEVSGSKVGTRSLLSYMPQRVLLPEHLTPHEIVTLFARMRGTSLDRVDEILEYVALKESKNRYVREFSGGMLQRVGLAVTFLADCEVYLLDEPTLNLDPLGIKRFRELAARLKEKGKTIVFASHLIEDAIQLADRVGILVDGTLAKIESVESFRADIASQMKVRIKLAFPLPEIGDILNQTGATMTTGNGTMCVFQAEPKDRLSIIRAIEGAGGIIEEFHTDPPNWEALIHDRFNVSEG
ncbi:MAG: ABC transporter ATP-binding protein [Bacteroidetes bacterium]|nr:ABC transporter ATP-binding protein [Bacteroidota bacterium]